MASRDTKHLNEVLADALVDTIDRFKKKYPDLPVPFTSCTYRGPDEQNELYAYPYDGKDNNFNGKIDERGERVTNAKGGQSPHNYLPALAFDIAFAKKDGTLDWSGHLFDKFATLLLQNHKGITWGGHFRSLKDKPHFEMSMWKTMTLGMNKVYRLQNPYMTGVKVKQIQNKIATELGIKTVADGIFGPDTDKLVRLYQKKKKLTVDGLVGPVTLKKLGI